MSAKRMKMAGAVGTALLLLILSVSFVSAGVGIGIASPPLDDLVVTPGQEFSFNIRVYNNGDDAFVAHLEVTGGLPATFDKNDFELAGGTSLQVLTTFQIPSGWQIGEVHEGDISVVALTPEGTSGGTASGQVVASISKHVVLKVGEEPDVPDEPEGPTAFGISVVLGVEPGVSRSNRTFSQTEVVVITVNVEVEANLTCIFHISQEAGMPVDLDKESEYYVGRLKLDDIPPEKYLLSVVAEKGGQSETLWTFLIVEPSLTQPFSWGREMVLIPILLVGAVVSIFIIRRRRRGGIL